MALLEVIIELTPRASVEIFLWHEDRDRLQVLAQLREVRLLGDVHLNRASNDVLDRDFGN